MWHCRFPPVSLPARRADDCYHVAHDNGRHSGTTQTVKSKTAVKHTTTTSTKVKKHPKKKTVKKTTTYKIEPPSVEVKVKPH